MFCGGVAHKWWAGAALAASTPLAPAALNPVSFLGMDIQVPNNSNASRDILSRLQVMLEAVDDL